MTLSQRDLCALTTASCSPSYTATRLWLNGNEESVTTNARLQACLTNLAALRQNLEATDPNLPILSKMHLHIVSKNDFPTAAGLASSAAGFAALVRAIADLYCLPQDPAELSRIARQGSGSACRSMFGGYVAWNMGLAEDGSDSAAEQIAPASHWPGMCAAILVVSDEKKGVSSTAGMQATVATSQLFKHRANNVVPVRMESMITAIRTRDFPVFAELTMADSNQFHAVCLDTQPPIFYLNDVSRAIIRLVEELNRVVGSVVAAYTFDAGPNAVIYYLEENKSWIHGMLMAFEMAAGWDSEAIKARDFLPDEFDHKLFDGLEDGVSRIIHTGVGEGPERCTLEKSLINEMGMPKDTSRVYEQR